MDYYIGLASTGNFFSSFINPFYKLSGSILVKNAVKNTKFGEFSSVLDVSKYLDCDDKNIRLALDN